MRDCDRNSLESGRPPVPARQAIGHALDRLFADEERDILEEVVPGLTFDVLIGALLLGRDLAEEDERRGG